MKIIVFEGIDHIGKTTLIKQIISELSTINAIYVKDDLQLNTVDKHNGIKTFFKDPSNFFEIKHAGYLLGVLNTLKLLNDDKVLLYDRLHWTEYAYAAALRPDSLVNIYDTFDNLIFYNKMFETKLMETFGEKNIILFTFVVKVKDENKIQDDEVFDGYDLKEVNYFFNLVNKHSVLNEKYMYKLSINKDGMSDIMKFKDKIIEKIKSTGESQEFLYNKLPIRGGLQI